MTKHSTKISKNTLSNDTISKVNVSNDSKSNNARSNNTVSIDTKSIDTKSMDARSKDFGSKKTRLEDIEVQNSASNLIKSELIDLGINMKRFFTNFEVMTNEYIRYRNLTYVLSGEHGALIAQNEEFQKEIRRLKKKLDIPTEESKRIRCKIVIMHNDPKDSSSDYDYNILLVNEKSKKSILEKLKNYNTEHPKAKAIFRAKSDLDGKKLWEIIQANTGNKIKVCGRDFSLVGKYTEERFIKDISR